MVKRDGRSEALSKQKLLGGMIKACEKRPVSVEVLEKAAEEIVRNWKPSSGARFLRTSSGRR